MIQDYSSFFSGVIITFLAIFLFRLTGLNRKWKWNKNTAKYIPPVLVMVIAGIIVGNNYSSLVNPIPIGKKTILNYLLTNPANLQLLLFITVVAIFILSWLVMTLPFSSQGLSKFSGFGISAEFREKLNTEVQKNAIVNELTSIRENILRILTSDKYFEETLKKGIQNFDENGFISYVIHPDKIVTSILKLMETSYKSSESHFRVQYHVETVKPGEEANSKKNIEELPKEMRDGCLHVMNKKKPFIWKGTLAMSVHPFKQDEDYYILCLFSDEIMFSEADCEYLEMLVKVAEKIVTLYTYQTEESDSSTGESGQVVS